jgi:hypothetical protein
MHAPIDHAAMPGPPDLIRRRRRTKRAAIILHAIGAIVPGLVVFGATGPAASPSDGPGNVSLAKVCLVFLAVFCVAQAGALIAWLTACNAVRAARGIVPGSRSRSEITNRGMIRASAELLFLAAWSLEAGYIAQLLSTMKDGGYSEQASGFTIGMVVLAVIMLFPALIFGAAGVLFARIDNGARRDAPALAAPGRPASQVIQGDLESQLSALTRARRSANRFILFCTALIAGVLAYAVWITIAGQWSFHAVTVLPVALLTSATFAIRFARMRRRLIATERRLRA